MLIHKKQTGYSSKRKYVQGRGFVDSLSSTLRNVGSYISQNKDLVAKPLLGAVEDLAAFGVTEAGKSVIMLSSGQPEATPNQKCYKNTFYISIVQWTHTGMYPRYKHLNVQW